MDARTIQYYAQHADDIVARYESIVSGMAAYFVHAFSQCHRILDVGCGSGRDMACLHRLGKSVYGIDATAELVERAQILHPELHGKIICHAVPSDSIPFGGGFDGILCSAVLMHIPPEQQPSAASFIKKCLNPGGKLFYSVPSKREDVASDLQRDPAGRLFIADSHRQLQRLFEKNGFTILEEWKNLDTLGRDGVEWDSFLMQRAAN
ncbi:MAG: class I SAM-dependent methyltransferase [Ottowia sp.]|nr:class I SAM-dependent methyltransferase [Ottowia sp.]